MTTAVAQKELLTRAEAAEYLGVKVQTLAVWACTGRYSLPLIRIGSRIIKYRKSDLDAFLQAHRDAADSAGN